MKKIIACLMAALILMTGLTACSGKNGSSQESNKAAANEKKLSIVCTNFPEYDFVRQIVGDSADITMLLKPGAESHTFEPTPADIITIQNSDLFVYVGGDSDKWVDGILESMDQSTMRLFKLMECVNLVEEELVEGMQPEENEKAESEEGPELDEHVWTSPANAIKIVQKLSDTICELYTADQNTIKANTADYLKKLQKLDDDFRDVISNAGRKEIIVGDRFPFRYLCEEFGLSYYAAFPGCSTDTEANASTVAFLIDKVKSDHIPVVFHIELSNEQMCNSICEATGAKSELLNAVHNVSDSDFKTGVTYIDLMEHNVEVLKEALN
jgi:zinc transport system substrate-binding protein